MLDFEKLKYIKKPKFLRERKILLINDTPLDLEMKSGIPFSSPSSSMLFGELAKAGIPRQHIFSSYLFNFRPPEGDISALFHQAGLPVSEYTSWGRKKEAILNFAYRDLQALRADIKEINPDLIICTGRWGLYFLTGETTVAQTKKSPFGTLLKWRASHLLLDGFWEYEKPHVLLPILPQQAIWRLPDYSLVIRQDFTRAGLIGKGALQGKIEDFTVAARGYVFHTENTFKETETFLVQQLMRLEEATSPIPYAIDVETRQGYHDCVGIAVSETEAICIPWSTTTSPLYWSEQEEVKLQHLFRLFLDHPMNYQIGQNYWYDMQYFWRDFLSDVVPSADTMVLQHTMFAGMEKNLAFLGSLYAKVYRYWKDEGATHKGNSDQDRWIYNCKDCCLTLEINNVMQKMLLQNPEGGQKAYENQLTRTLPTLVRMMRRGVRADTKEKSRLYGELTEVMKVISAEMTEILGEPFNPNSPPQKKEVFYDLFQLPVQRDPKTHRPTTNALALETLMELDPLIKPFAERVSEFGNLKVFSSTVLKAGLDIDNRLRTSYNMCGTDTFRLSSSQNAFGSGLNLQNISKGGTTATGRKLPNCKSLILPDKGMTMFDADLDSADLRIVVAISGATGLGQMLDEGLKPYVELMKMYYNDPTLTKHSDKYKTFKAVTHATNYIGSSVGISGRVGLLVHEVEKLQKYYFAENPEIKKWHKELEKQVHKRGWIENVFGYRKYIFNKQFPTIMQVCAAWNPQSTIGLLINEAMNRIDAAHEAGELPVELLLQVHDSLVGQFPQEQPECREEILKHFEIELPYEKPIIIPADMVTSTVDWAGCS